jgi:MoaA/NifB/PqqE/SkfB family radical SAM enzyme
MCSIVDLLPKSEELSTKQIIKIIDDAKAYGIKEVLLTGGEPLLRKDIFEICLYCHQSGLRSIVTTNSVLIDEAMADQIVKSKMGHIHISIEGLEETNDFFRGKGSFNKVMNAVKILNIKRSTGDGFSTGFACTVMQNNVQDLFNIAKLADDLGVDVINFQPLVKDNANFNDKKLPEFWVKEAGLAHLKDQIRKIRDYKFKHVSIYEEPSLELLIKYYQGTLSRKDWVCFGGFKTVFVCYSKSEPLVYSCHGVCGNLDKMTLKQAWQSMEAHNLRIHSRDCTELCMQSCYSMKNAQHLGFLNQFRLGACRKNG